MEAVVSFRLVPALAAGVLLCSLAVAPAHAAPGVNPGQDKRDIAWIQAQVDNHTPSAKTLITAHRGSWRAAPENSLAAIDEAITHGADIIELDVEVTKDGVAVLMHDDTVDRTTKGRGRVTDMTLAEVKKLRLLNHMGRDDAATETNQTVPTLEEAMLAVKGRAMVNLDKAWPERHVVADVLRKTGTADHVIIKGSPTVAEAVDYLDANPGVRYAHVLNDNNWRDAYAFPASHVPTMFEVVFNTDADAQAQPDFLAELSSRSRIFVNTMWDTLAAGHTDEATLRQAPGLGWQELVTHYHATVLQTDNVAAMDYWRDGGPIHLWERQPGANSIRLLPGTHVTEGAKGVDFDDADANRCAAASPQFAWIDLCDGSTYNHTRGALALAHPKPGEYLTFTFDVQRAGTYDVIARTGTQYVAGGRVRLVWDGEVGATHVLRQTSHLGIFMRDNVERRHLDKGRHTLRLEVTEGHRQDFNLDYIQLDYVGRG